MKIRNSVLVSLLFSSLFTTANAAEKIKASPAGHVTAWGATLDEMTNALESAATKAGATDLKVTSAYAGNRYYGTAIIYK
ncbi:YdgH/BhsA/McbA-like domain containing protein [Pantoea agglomerans]